MTLERAEERSWGHAGPMIHGEALARTPRPSPHDRSGVETYKYDRPLSIAVERPARTRCPATSADACPDVAAVSSSAMASQSRSDGRCGGALSGGVASAHAAPARGDGDRFPPAALRLRERNVVPAEQLEPLSGELSPELRARREPGDRVGRGRRRLRRGSEPDDPAVAAVERARVAAADLERLPEVEGSVREELGAAQDPRDGTGSDGRRGDGQGRRAAGRRGARRAVVVDIPAEARVVRGAHRDRQRLPGDEVQGHLHLRRARRRRLGGAAQRGGREREAGDPQGVGRGAEGDGGVFRRASRPSIRSRSRISRSARKRRSTGPSSSGGSRRPTRCGRSLARPASRRSIKRPVRSAPDGLSLQTSRRSFSTSATSYSSSRWAQIALFETNDPLSRASPGRRRVGDYSEEWTTSLRGAYVDGAFKRMKLLGLRAKIRWRTERTTSTSDRMSCCSSTTTPGACSGSTVESQRRHPTTTTSGSGVSEIFSFSYDSGGQGGRGASCCSTRIGSTTTQRSRSTIERRRASCSRVPRTSRSRRRDAGAARDRPLVDHGAALAPASSNAARDAGCASCHPARVAQWEWSHATRNPGPARCSRRASRSSAVTSASTVTFPALRWRMRRAGSAAATVMRRPIRTARARPQRCARPTSASAATSSRRPNGTAARCVRPHCRCRAPTASGSPTNARAGSRHLPVVSHARGRSRHARRARRRSAAARPGRARQRRRAAWRRSLCAASTSAIAIPTGDLFRNLTLEIDDGDGDWRTVAREGSDLRHRPRRGDAGRSQGRDRQHDTGAG